MAEEMTTQDGFTEPELETTHRVLEALSNRHAENGRSGMAETLAQAAYLVDAYKYLDADWSSSYDLPEVGDVVTDPESNPRYGDGRVKVSQVLDTKEARLHYVDMDTGKRSVAWLNPSHPGDAPVVLGRYVEGSDKVYAFPSTRLE